MTIRVHPRAVEQLRKLGVSDNQALRIDASLEGGGCGCNVVYAMLLDEATPSDVEEFTESGIRVLLSPMTISWIGETLSLNYLDNVGFSLANDEQILTYGLKFTSKAG